MMDLFNVVLVVLAWGVAGLYHNRIYSLLRKFTAPDKVLETLPWWSEQHFAGTALLALLALAMILHGANMIDFVGASLIGKGLLFEPLINLAYGRSYFARPGRSHWTLKVGKLSVNVPHGILPHLAVVLIGVAVVYLRMHLL